MRLLLDSHALIWWVDRHQQLSSSAYAAIADPGNDLLVSAATIWEIAIKVGLGRLSLSAQYRQWMLQAISNVSATVLPISVPYADVQAALPRHHRDPFDRMLVAQATMEQVAIVSNDVAFDAYGVQRVW